MRKLRFLVVFAAWTMMAGAMAWAGSKDVGTTGSAFLKLGQGARPAGMGGAFTALADDVNAIGWNPAGLSRLETPEFTAMHAQSFQQVDFAAVSAAAPTQWGTFGFGFSSLAVDNIEKRAGDTDAADSAFNSRDAAYRLSYARPLGDDFSAGVTALFIRQALDGQTASAFAGDVGLLWRTPHRPLQVGLALRNAGGKIKFMDEGDPLPLTGALGLGYTVLQNRLRLGADLILPRDNDIQTGVGFEFQQPVAKEVSGALRAGYTSVSTDATDGTGATMGLGLEYKRFSFDLAWAPYGVLGNIFRYSFLIKF